MMQSVIEYYSDEKVLQSILDSVEHPNLRVWKVEYSDRSYKSNDRRINSTKQLKNLLFDMALDENNNEIITKIPSKVYVSVAKFSNPQKFYGKKPKKAAYVIADATMLRSDLLFDCDSEDDLSIAHEDAKKILSFMHYEKDYELINIRFSGKKGFHLLYKDNKPIYEQHPILRMNKTEDRRRELVNRLPELKTIDDIHKGIICDQTRVHAALNTVKLETGNVVKQIPVLDFMFDSTEELIKRYVERAVRPEGPMIMDDSILTSILGKEKPVLISYPYTYNFIDNKVKGTSDNFITVLKYRQEEDKKIKKLQKQYNLSDFYKLEYKGIFIYLNFKLVNLSRLKKIMRSARPINLNSFLFYKHTWIPISESIDKAGNVVCEKPKLLEVIDSPYAKNDAHSRPHARLFDLIFPVMAGNKQNRVCKASVEEIT